MNIGDERKLRERTGFTLISSSSENKEQQYQQKNYHANNNNESKDDNHYQQCKSIIIPRQSYQSPIITNSYQQQYLPQQINHGNNNLDTFSYTTIGAGLSPNQNPKPLLTSSMSTTTIVPLIGGGIGVSKGRVENSSPIVSSISNTELANKGPVMNYVQSNNQQYNNHGTYSDDTTLQYQQQQQQPMTFSNQQRPSSQVLHDQMNIIVPDGYGLSSNTLTDSSMFDSDQTVDNKRWKNRISRRFHLFKSSVSSWCSFYSVLMLAEGERAQTVFMYELTRATFSTVVCFMLFLLVAIVGVRKMSINGFGDYVSYFTNWAWTLHGIYYGLAFVGHMFYPSVLRFSIYFFTMTVNGVSWSVLLIVSVIIYNNPDILLDMISGFGGENPAGLVLVMNCVFHPLALVIFLVFALLHGREISRTFYDAKKATLAWLKYGRVDEGFGKYCNNPSEDALEVSRMNWYKVLFSLIIDVWWIYSPIIMLGIYMIFNNPTEVYGYPIMGTETGLAVFIICTFINGVPYMIMSYCPRLDDPEACLKCGKGHPSNQVDVTFMTLYRIIYSMRDDNNKQPDEYYFNRITNQSRDLEYGFFTPSGSLSYQDHSHVNSANRNHQAHNAYSNQPVSSQINLRGIQDGFSRHNMQHPTNHNLPHVQPR